ncbi:hypothetical protein LXL04_023070 [Taraxacum kok-saghyz]
MKGLSLLTYSSPIATSAIKVRNSTVLLMHTNCYQDIPDVGQLEGDVDPHHADVEMATADEAAVKELDEMKKRLKDMEEEAAALREMQAKPGKQRGGRYKVDICWQCQQQITTYSQKKNMKVVNLCISFVLTLSNLQCMEVYL